MESCARLLISYPLIVSGQGCLRESVSVGRCCTGILTEFRQGVRKSFLLTTVSISDQWHRFIVKFRARKEWAQVLVQEFSFHPRQAGLQPFAMHCPSSVNQVTRFISLPKMQCNSVSGQEYTCFFCFYFHDKTVINLWLKLIYTLLQQHCTVLLTQMNKILGKQGQPVGTKEFSWAKA